jgi:hypothetical protein
MRISTRPSLVLARPRKLTLTTAFCALAGGLLLTGAPALAGSRATHVFTEEIGHAGEGPGQLSEPADVAVNESKGLLYVADVGNDRVDEFETNGTFVRAWGGGVLNGEARLETCTATCQRGVSGNNPGEFARPESIAVDNDPGSPSFGDVYVADQGHGAVDKFSSAGAYINQVTETGAWQQTLPNGQSVGGPGGPLGGPIIEEVSGGGTNDSAVIGLGVALDSSGGLWVDQRTGGVGYVDGFSGARKNAYLSTRPADASQAPGFAVDSAGDFYLYSIGVTKFNGAGGILVEGIDKESTTGLAVELSTGSLYVDNVGTVARFSSDGTFEERFGAGQLTSGSGLAVSSATSDVYVADAASGVVHVAVNEPGKPSVEGEAVSKVSALSATLSANVNTYGLPTTYTIEYGTSEIYGSIAKTGSVPGSYGGLVAVSTTLEGLLQSETAYHFRVVAENADGTSRGPDTTFSTYSDFPGLPDGRGFEMVSSIANADGNVYEPSGAAGSRFGAQTTALPMQAAADGDAVRYVADPPATGGNGNVGKTLGNEYVATRASGGGWSAVDLETPGLEKAPFEALFSEALFSSGLSNSGTSAVPAGSDKLSATGEGVFDSVGGREVLVSVLPSTHPGEQGTPMAQAGIPGSSSHVMSANGSRIFWVDGEIGPDQGRIFVRENLDVTVPVSTGSATFWTASPDGRYAFYTEGETLWRFDVQDGTREDLSGEGAGVLGVVGVNETGEDGSYVYFVAQGVLAPGATVGDCAETTGLNSHGVGSCNLYVRHDGATAFIASLSGSDNHNYRYDISSPGGDWRPGLAERTAEVAPDGHSLVFLSDQSLTGYPNDGAYEVFTYDADTGQLSCVSCNPTGVPPTKGASRVALARPLLQSSFDGSFMHRWISADGTRVFFESNEPLVARDTVAQDAEGHSVYEWEREGAGECAPKVPARQDGGCLYLLSGGTSNAFLLDASASGDDVFIISRAALTPQDPGETFEVYDVRVGAVAPLAERACTGTGCQGLPSAPPPFATPSSVTFDGVGNFPGGTGTNRPAVVKLKTKRVKCAKPRRLIHGKCVKPKKNSKARKSNHSKGGK